MKATIIILSIILAILMVLLLFNNMSFILSDIGINVKPLPVNFNDIVSILKR